VAKQTFTADKASVQIRIICVIRVPIISPSGESLMLLVTFMANNMHKPPQTVNFIQLHQKTCTNLYKQETAPPPPPYVCSVNKKQTTQIQKS
jgi:hypothetical protein